MTGANGKIIVSCNMSQKDTMVLEGRVFQTASLYETNYREKSPVLCKVQSGNEFVREGQILIVHHNTFYQPSPYYLEYNLFAIPFGKTIFAILNFDGSLTPVCGNVLCERIDIPTPFHVPSEERKKYIDRVIVKDGGWTAYKPNDILFTRPHSYYEIVYIVDGQERRTHKCDSEMVCGVIKAKN